MAHPTEMVLKIVTRSG